MISVSGLSYAYHPAKEIRFADIRVGDGQPLLLLGESGSGKTTLLHLLGGLLRSQQGTIEINGINIAGMRESALDRFRGQHIGFVFQRNHLINALTVRKNLLMAPFLAGLPQNRDRVDEVLRVLGLSGNENSPVSQLSHGQAQRVAIARAIINRPSVILADEPTSALDDKNCDRVISLLLEASGKQNATLIVATHDQRLKERISNQIHLA